MPGVLEKRRQFLQLMKRFTLEEGHFTVTDIARKAGCPRSTAQDWINRLLSERCIMLLEGKKGRQAARYAATSAIIRSACKRIFTTLDGEWVQIYHECLSASSAAFCEHHHRLAGGALCEVIRDGTLLRECGRLGEGDADIGLYPKPSVGVLEIRKEAGNALVQRIRCVGGPAYSLTEMMGQADGVTRVDLIRSEGGLVEGEVITRALTYLAIGIDDTDSSMEGATFALAIALLQFISRMEGVMPIGHQVVILNPDLPEKTVGNYASFIEVAIEPEIFGDLQDRVIHFVSDGSFSPEWGIAFKTGFSVTPELRDYLAGARGRIVTTEEAERVAEENGIILHGGRGKIGALAAVAAVGLSTPVLMDPEGRMEARYPASSRGSR
ncbi:MAG: sugar-specific transcriptional regulator TrmB [Methanomicrobiales archaeon]|jgi:hypothetical protein|nr:sugar-specific transcriptional regulator TrmB [Methanomicrobiales archaeon]